MKPSSRDALSVIWRVSDGREELPGIVLYGLTEPDGWYPQPFPYAAWPPEAEYEESYLYGEHWLVVIWDVRLPQWPSAQGWHTALRYTLQRLLNGGCVVSWLGDGFLFNDPPELLLPGHMSGGVLATLTPTGEYTCHFNSDTPVVEISDEEMLAFRRHTRGLADVE